MLGPAISGCVAKQRAKLRRGELAMTKAIMCGTDLHDRNMVCRISVDLGTPVTKTYGNTETGKRSLFRYLKGESKRNGCARVVLAYEASTQGFCLYDDCSDAGIESFVLAPDKIRKSGKDRKGKGDEKDAQLILETLRGHLLAGNELPSIWVPDHATRADRETVRSRLDLGTKLTATKTQVRTLLKSHRLRKPKEVGNGWSKAYRGWLQSLCPDGAWPGLATLLRQIEFLEAEIEQLDKAILELSATARYAQQARMLMGRLKGVGLLTAMVFLTEIGDMRRFANRRQVGAFMGLVPRSNESGESDDRKGHITRSGSPRLRRVLCQAAWSRVRSDPDACEAYQRIVQRNPKHKKIAIVAMMRRLGIRMWHVAHDVQTGKMLCEEGPLRSGADAA
jgi:transposase